MKSAILVAESFVDRPCHTCGAMEDISFLRFRTKVVEKTEVNTPSEVYLRLCAKCRAELKAKL